MRSHGAQLAVAPERELVLPGRGNGSQLPTHNAASRGRLALRWLSKCAYHPPKHLLMLDALFPVSHSCPIVQPDRFMTSLIRNPLRFIALFALSCNACFAQVSGQFSLDFDPSTPLIDMNGTFSVTDQIVGAADQPITLAYSIHLTHAGNGALRGVP